MHIYSFWQSVTRTTTTFKLIERDSRVDKHCTRTVQYTVPVHLYSSLVSSCMVHFSTLGLNSFNVSHDSKFQSP